MSNFQDRIEMKKSLIEKFPNAIIFIPNSPLSAELVSQIIVADSIDAMVRMQVGTSIDIKDFQDHLKKLDDLREKMTQVNEQLIQKIASVDAFFNAKGKMRPGLIANRGARKVIEAKRKELLTAQEKAVEESVAAE